MKKTRIRPRERDSIIQSLKAGVTPRNGIQHIQVGRVNEIKAVIRDIERISDGGSAFRLIIGDYGSGKTFFMGVARDMALQNKIVTAHADLSPDRRIQASQGQARNLYSELMRNISTRSKQDGNALSSIVEKFISTARAQAESKGKPVEHVIQERLSELNDLVGGYDFSKVIGLYWKAFDTDDEELKSNVIRWLRAEYTTKTDARKDLGVRNIIDDKNFYDSIKLMSLFVKQAGYAGLLVNLDEMVNLYKLRSTQARTSNYEQILRILNDSLQGGTSHLGFILGGTPEFLMDPRRGLYSYEALQSRLAENSFAKSSGVIDYSSPTIHLASLTPEELYILLKNLRHVFASGDPEEYLVPDNALISFLEHCSSKIGDAYFRTPRNTIKAFTDMLSVLEQNDNIEWKDLIEDVSVRKERPSEIDDDPIEDNDELADFRL